ncbi:hypothetical protein BD309DRAFT_1005268 [Dichomitus squalens]|uniref:Fungal-type protein kinase domain-containing protein n=1 Tax=Dichomitus squalens TaxID=114155 RepID=A0A4V2K8I3_9APHY|nr:hypothetical protein BD309DRAFT_1005268 [Dichomitus squalens]TBU60088.1 hypothetical protein BD310DRAFT_947486 [Dichomitus squalens]
MTPLLVQLGNDEFSRAFLRPSHINVREKRVSLAPFSLLKHARNMDETEISQLFISAVNSHHLIPGSMLVQNAHGLASIIRSLHVPRRGQAHWADQRVPVYFFPRVPDADPFAGAEKKNENTEAGRERKRRLEQMSEAVERLFSAQHRVFLFTIVIFGRKFRLIRWDRAGMIATPPTDYYGQPGILCDYLRRLSLFDDAFLGFDPTATRVLSRDPDFLRMDVAATLNNQDLDHFECYAEEGEVGGPHVFRYVRSMFRDSLSSDWPRYRLQVPDGDSMRDYLVGKPVVQGSNVFGRGMRGYVAFDCQTGCFVWLKDVWRPSEMIAEREGDVLRELNEAGIENVPTLICHGDVGDQATVTDLWWSRGHTTSPTSPSSSASTSPSSTGRKRKRAARLHSDNGVSRFRSRQAPSANADPPCPLRRHTHYRVIVKEIALPLKNFQRGKQLASIVLDCLRAHHQAATNPATMRLHGDISGDNILIYPMVRQEKDGRGYSIVWTGLLIDWELSKHRDSEDVPTSEGRMGTHEFMSVNLLGNLHDPVKISDELESFFHVLVYCSVRYLRSNCTSPNSWLDNYFYFCGFPNAYTGALKSVAIKQHGYLSTLVPEGPLLFDSPMDQLLGTLIKSFRAHYKIMYHQALNAPTPSFASSSSSGTESQKAARAAALAIFAVESMVPVTVLEDDPEFAEYEANKQPIVLPDKTPTEEDRQLASRVADHSFALDFVSQLLHRNDWPDDDRIPQRPAPPPPAHEPDVEPDVEEPAPPTKRRRTTGPKEKTASPTRAGTEVRRTRSRTRAAAAAAAAQKGPIRRRKT